MLEKLSVWNTPWARGDIYINVVGSFEAEIRVGKESGGGGWWWRGRAHLKLSGLGWVGGIEAPVRSDLWVLPSTLPIRMENLLASPMQICSLETINTVYEFPVAAFTNLSQTECSHQQKFILSWFSRPKVQNQGVDMGPRPQGTVWQLADWLSPGSGQHPSISVPVLTPGPLSPGLLSMSCNDARHCVQGPHQRSMASSSLYPPKPRSQRKSPSELPQRHGFWGAGEGPSSTNYTCFSAHLHSLPFAIVVYQS